MRQHAAGTADDADHALRLQLRQFRRCNVLADQDFPGHALGAGRALVQERLDAADDVIQVIQAAFKIGIFHAFEDLGQAIALYAQRVTGAVTLAANQFVQCGEQLRVVQQHGVQIKEFAHFGGQCALQARAQFAHFRARCIGGAVQALQLLLNPGSGNALFTGLLYMRPTHTGAAQRGPT
ncbi:hypothetical protein D3C81_962270 [compost metagenome]